MNKGILTEQVAESLFPLMSAIQWWGFAGSYAHQPKSAELLTGKDVDIVIWLSDASKCDEALQSLALLSLRSSVLLHPVLLLHQDRNRYTASGLYRDMIASVEKIYEAENAPG